MDYLMHRCLKKSCKLGKFGAQVHSILLNWPASVNVPNTLKEGAKEQAADRYYGVVMRKIYHPSYSEG
jgi:hypothetical protein